MNAELGPFERRMVDFVESHGCFINAIFDPEGRETDFAYSAGFPASVGQLDVHISGLKLDLMKVLINDALALCRDGFQLSDFARTDQLFSSAECTVRRVDPSKLIPEYWNSAIWYQEQYRGERFEGGFQLVWPDKAGAFPWESSFDHASGGGQLHLWEAGTIQ